MKAILLLAGSLAFGSASADPPSLPVQISVHWSDPAKLRLVGETNLPDGTKLTLHIHRLDSNANQGNRYGVGLSDGQTTSVNRGHFDFGTQTDKTDEHLIAGEYRVEFGMMFPLVQPASVQSVIGPGGEHLMGPLVLFNPMLHMKYIQLRTGFVVTGGPKYSSDEYTEDNAPPVRVGPLSPIELDPFSAQK